MITRIGNPPRQARQGEQAFSNSVSARTSTFFPLYLFLSSPTGAHPLWRASFLSRICLSSCSFVLSCLMGTFFGYQTPAIGLEWELGKWEPAQADKQMIQSPAHTHTQP